MPGTKGEAKPAKGRKKTTRKKKPAARTRASAKGKDKHSGTEKPPLPPPPQDEIRPNCFASSPSLKTRRVFYIAMRMAANRWPRGGKQIKELAEEWELEPATVRGMSSDAARLLDLIGHRKQLVEIGRIRLLEIMNENGSDRVSAIRTMFENLGELSSRKKVELGGEIGMDGARLVFLPEEDDLDGEEPSESDAASGG